MLRRNTEHLRQRVRALHTALWGRRATLELGSSARHHGAAREWNIMVSESQAKMRNFRPRAQRSAVVAMTMSEIQRCFRASIDFVKLDVEGAEVSLFGGNTGWLGEIRYLYMELHPSTVGRDAIATILDTLLAHNMTVIASSVTWGESIYLACSGRVPPADCHLLCAEWRCGRSGTCQRCRGTGM